MTKTSMGGSAKSGSVRVEVRQQCTSGPCNFRPRTSSFTTLNDSSPAADQIHQEQDHGNHKKHMDDPACDVERQAKNPEQQQQNDKRPEHVGYLPLRESQPQSTYHNGMRIGAHM